MNDSKSIAKIKILSLDELLKVETSPKEKLEELKLMHPDPPQYFFHHLNYEAHSEPHHDILMKDNDGKYLLGIALKPGEKFSYSLDNSLFAYKTQIIKVDIDPEGTSNTTFTLQSPSMGYDDYWSLILVVKENNNVRRVAVTRYSNANKKKE